MDLSLRAYLQGWKFRQALLAATHGRSLWHALEHTGNGRWRYTCPTGQIAVSSGQSFQTNTTNRLCVLQVPPLGVVPQRAATHYECLQDPAVPLEQRPHGRHQVPRAAGLDDRHGRLHGQAELHLLLPQVRRPTQLQHFGHETTFCRLRWTSRLL